MQPWQSNFQVADRSEKYEELVTGLERFLQFSKRNRIGAFTTTWDGNVSRSRHTSIGRDGLVLVADKGRQ